MRCPVDLARDAVQHPGMDDTILGIFGIFVMAGAAREVGAHGRMRTGQRAIADAVTVDILMAAPVRIGIETGSVQVFDESVPRRILQPPGPENPSPA